MKISTTIAALIAPLILATGLLFGYPFERGKAFTVVLGFNGGLAHSGRTPHAVDFKMPVGTPVYAAKAGKVIQVENDYTEGGNNPALASKANNLIINHGDGTFGNYLHFKFRGIVVTKGQTVNKGDLVGYSGQTGYTTDPHLHFDIRVPDERHYLSDTIAWKFRNPQTGEIF